MLFLPFLLLVEPQHPGGVGQLLGCLLDDLDVLGPHGSVQVPPCLVELCVGFHVTPFAVFQSLYCEQNSETEQ